MLQAALVEVGPTFLPAGEQLALELRESAALPGRSGHVADAAAVGEQLLARMSERATAELASRQALVGPHRDELVIGHAHDDAPARPRDDLRRFASSGQQRNALLALKMAKVEVFRRHRGEAPVLLVDDVDTEVDPTRLGTFLAHVGQRCQTILTSSKEGLVQDLGARALRYRVARGIIESG
jgi:DNA replication and repair protein RecF